MTMGVGWLVSLLFSRVSPLLGGFFLLLMSLHHMLSAGSALLAQWGLPVEASFVGGVILFPLSLALMGRGIYG